MRKTVKAKAMSTSYDDSKVQSALLGIPKKFRDRILDQFLSVKKNFLEGKDEPAGMAAAKLCEVVLRFLQHEITGTNIPFNKSIGNLPNECRKLIEASNSNVPDALRVIMPRMLVCLYTFRNKRDIGHIGGDVDSNRIDAATITRLSDWVICELIRVYHQLSIEEAQDLVDAISQRTLPDVWVVSGKKRVLRTDLSTKDQTLLLCFHDETAAILVEDLCDWIEYSSVSMFKKRVLSPLHAEKLIEHDQDTDTVIISPLGIKRVEETILSSAS